MAVIVYSELTPGDTTPGVLVFAEATDYWLDVIGHDVVAHVTGADGKKIATHRRWSTVAIVDEGQVKAFAANVADVTVAALAGLLGCTADANG